MAIYRVTVYKRLVSAPSVKWTNVYVVNSSNLVTALDDGEALMQAEKDISKIDVQFYKLSSRGVGGGLSAQRDINETGDITPVEPTHMLPRWNVVMVTLHDNVGKAERKYLRPPLHSEDTIGQALTPEIMTLLVDDYAAALVLTGVLCGPNGEVITSVTVDPNVRMRQTDWNRRFRPGFKRGWVAA